MAASKAVPSQDESRSCPTCQHDMPAVTFILKSFSLNMSDVLNIYVVGSHVWGSCTRHSDWDLVIVTKEQPLHAMNAHKNKLDAWILSVDEYTTFIKDHLLQALITLWLPKVFVLKEVHKPISCFKYVQSNLFASIDKMYQRDMRVAQKHFTKSDPKGGTKILRHCLRQMELSLQIQRHHYILDYTLISQEEINLKERVYEGVGVISWEEVMAIVSTRMNTILSILQLSTAPNNDRH